MIHRLKYYIQPLSTFDTLSDSAAPWGIAVFKHRGENTDKV